MEAGKYRPGGTREASGRAPDLRTIRPDKQPQEASDQRGAEASEMRVLRRRTMERSIDPAGVGPHQWPTGRQPSEQPAHPLSELPCANGDLSRPEHRLDGAILEGPGWRNADAIGLSPIVPLGRVGSNPTPGTHIVHTRSLLLGLGKVRRSSTLSSFWSHVTDRTRERSCCSYRWPSLVWRV